MVLPFFSPLRWFCGLGSGRGEEPSGGNVLRLIQIRLATLSLAKISPNCQDQRDRVLTTNGQESPQISPSSLVSIRVYSWLAFRVYREMLVLEVFRHALCLFHLDLFGRGVERVVGFAAFRRATHVSGGMRQRNTRFGQPDKFRGLLRRNGEWLCFWIG